MRWIAVAAGIVLVFTGLVFALRSRDASAAKDVESACLASSDGAACDAAGEQFLEGTRAVPADDARAIAVLKKGCELDRGMACARLGYLAAYGRYGTEGVPEAVVLYDKGCRLDSWLGCANLAAVLQEGGWGVEADPERARKALARACELGDDESCPGADVHHIDRVEHRPKRR